MAALSNFNFRLSTEMVRQGDSHFFPSNGFLRRRRKKASLRVNDRGGGWRMCILALCRACVCPRVLYVRTCVLLYQISHARAIACMCNVCTVCIQYTQNVTSSYNAY